MTKMKLWTFLDQYKTSLSFHQSQNFPPSFLLCFYKKTCQVLNIFCKTCILTYSVLIFLNIFWNIWHFDILSVVIECSPPTQMDLTTPAKLNWLGWLSMIWVENTTFFSWQTWLATWRVNEDVTTSWPLVWKSQRLAQGFENSKDISLCW